MWIQSHEEVSRHYKTQDAADELGISIPQMVGHLHMFWHWCLAFAQNGELHPNRAKAIARAVMWEREPEEFLAALIKHNFIDESEGALHVHDWHVYGGKLIERREKEAERKRATRHPQPDLSTKDECAQDVRRTSAGCPALEKSTEDKNRLDNSTENNSSPIASAARTKREPQISVSSEQVETIYQAYPRKEAKGAALKAIDAAVRRIAKGSPKPDNWDATDWPPMDAVGFLLHRVQVYADAMAETELRFIPHPATWFNEGRYLNEIIQANQNANGTRALSKREQNFKASLIYN